MNLDAPQPAIKGRAALPSTMESLLETAIRDARSLDKSTFYPHFEHWHHIQSRALMKVCAVCLAGSVISRTLNVASDESISPSGFDKRTHRLLLALDDMRNGDWLYAFLRIYEQMPPDEIEDKLLQLGMPDHIEFTGWNQFESHLASLEDFLSDLRQIDRIWKKSQSKPVAGSPASGSPLPAMQH